MSSARRVQFDSLKDLLSLGHFVNDFFISSKLIPYQQDFITDFEELSEKSQEIVKKYFENPKDEYLNEMHLLNREMASDLFVLIDLFFTLGEEEDLEKFKEALRGVEDLVTLGVQAIAQLSYAEEIVSDLSINRQLILKGFSF